ncbi:MAG: hypothetical protein U1A78_41245 [Polyangia bacterium]
MPGTRTRSVIFLFAGWLVCGSAVGCSSTPDNPVEADMAMDLASAVCQPDPGYKSDCGKPCDKGNSVGIGRFCATLNDCSDNGRAVLCSILGDPNTHFCTFTCKKMGPPDQCGEGATCVCSGAACGCTPTACLGIPDDGGTASDGGTTDGGTRSDL